MIPEQFRMLLPEPLREIIEAAPATLGPHVRTPFGPALDDSAVAKQTHDFPKRRVFDQPNGGPAPGEPVDAQLAAEQLATTSLVDIVVPDIWQAPSVHGSMVIQVGPAQGVMWGAAWPGTDDICQSSVSGSAAGAVSSTARSVRVSSSTGVISSMEDPDETTPISSNLRAAGRTRPSSEPTLLL